MPRKPLTTKGKIAIGIVVGIVGVAAIVLGVGYGLKWGRHSADDDDDGGGGAISVHSHSHSHSHTHSSHSPPPPPDSHGSHKFELRFVPPNTLQVDLGSWQPTGPPADWFEFQKMITSSDLVGGPVQSSNVTHIPWPWDSTGVSGEYAAGVPGQDGRVHWTPWITVH